MAEPIEDQEPEPEGEPEPSPFEGPANPLEPADDAEAEEDAEHEGVLPPEPEPEPEPRGMSEKELEKSLKGLERAATTFRGKVEQIMGAEAAMLLPCPLCEPIIPGFVMQVDEARKSAVRAFLGDREPDNLQADPHSRRCEACDGHGEVLTGSRVQAQLVAPCIECNGRGWLGDRVAPGTVPPIAPHGVPIPNGSPPPGMDADDFAAVERLRSKRIVVIVPEPPPIGHPAS